jgi:hypothetical protein
MLSEIGKVVVGQREMVQGIVMGLLMALSSYIPVRRFFLSLRERRLKRHRLDNRTSRRDH